MPSAFLASSPLPLRGHSQVLVCGKSHRHVVRRVRSARVGPSMRSEALVPYFAYFANLNPNKLGPRATGLRRCDVARTEEGVLSGWRLCFDVPGPPPEPAFGNVERAPGDCVRGMVYWMSAGDFDRIARSEGALLPRLPFLPRVDVIDVQVDIPTGTVRAKTFRFRGPLIPQVMKNLLRPSRRYVQLAVDGARFWHMDKSYVRDVLQKIQTAEGPLGGFGLFLEGRPHVLDMAAKSPFRPGNVSEVFSPFKAIGASEALKAFDDDTNIPKDDALRLVSLTSHKDDPSRRLLVFFPGIDGTGRSILSQVKALEEASWDVRSVVYPYGNRQSLPELAADLVDLVASNAAGRPVSIFGESMGGVLALMYVLENARRTRIRDNSTDANGTPAVSNIDFLLMLNPASCYSRSAATPVWDTVLNLGLSESVYKTLLPPILLPLIIDIDAVREGFSMEMIDRLRNMLSSLSQVADVLPMSALIHRIALLESFALSSRDYDEIGASLGRRIGLISSVNDNLLPSLSESYRLKRKLPDLISCLLSYGGHAPMQDTRFRLVDYLRPFESANFAEHTNTQPAPVTLDTAADSKLLQRRDAIRARMAKRTQGSENGGAKNPLSRSAQRRLTALLSNSIHTNSPVFVGEENLPSGEDGRPVLLIGNHTLLGWYDAMHPVQRILQTNGVLVRSLAHPQLFASDQLRLPGTPTVTLEDMEMFGVTQVNPRNLIYQLAQGNWCLLFPGGARESLKRKGDSKYSLHWREGTEFVRAAALFDAVIVPLSTVGTEDMVRILLDSGEIRNVIETGAKVMGVPLTPPRTMMGAGGGASKWRGDGDDEDLTSMIPPLGIPTGMERLYYRFGKPITVPTAALDDAELARKVYNSVKDRVAEGVDVLLQRREQDEYNSTAKRRAFNLTNGSDVQAPAGPAWVWSRSESGYLDEDLQPPLRS